jgi:hypothetical protein
VERSHSLFDSFIVKEGFQLKRSSSCGYKQQSPWKILLGGVPVPKAFNARERHVKVLHVAISNGVLGKYCLGEFRFRKRSMLENDT